ncbi:MAG: CPBP family intramembrane glutamic endopeptidase [Acidobacteriaceae bacterium]
MQEAPLNLETNGSIPMENQPVAPLWHTILFVAVLLGWSVLNGKARHGMPTGHHVALYSFTLLWEWFLLAVAVLGLRNRKALLREWLGAGWKGIYSLFDDSRAAGIFWLASLIVLSAMAALLGHAGLHPEQAQKTVTKIAPHGAAEILLWIALSITAGLCEEILFRGYLQQQFARVTGRLWLGILLSALVFGASHAYEGKAAMINLALFGALFGVLAVVRRNLRAGILAHAWHDAFTGIALTMLHHAGKL